jgi:hypothetical protein
MCVVENVEDLKLSVSLSQIQRRLYAEQNIVINYIGSENCVYPQVVRIIITYLPLDTGYFILTCCFIIRKEYDIIACILVTRQ